MLLEAATYIYECAIEAPNFAAYAGAELLQRTAAAAERLEAAFQRVPVAAHGDLSEESSARFEVEYRRRIVRTYDSLVLFGTDIPEERYRRYPLSSLSALLGCYFSPHPSVCAAACSESASSSLMSWRSRRLLSNQGW